jgi:hypothetical protein
MTWVGIFFTIEVATKSAVAMEPQCTEPAIHMFRLWYLTATIFTELCDRREGR